MLLFGYHNTYSPVCHSPYVEIIPLFTGDIVASFTHLAVLFAGKIVVAL